MEFFTFFAVLVTVGLVWYYKTFYQIFKKVSKLPGPVGLPIIGNALEFFGKSQLEILKALEEIHKKYGFMVRLSIGPFEHVILLTDPKYAEYILGSQKHITKSSEYEQFLNPWLGTGLLTSTGQKWSKRRKVCKICQCLS
jgi:cytochrome P450 family 4